MSIETIEAVDRYTGIGYPDLETVCPGDCEGTGFVPIHRGKVYGPDDSDGLHLNYCPDLDTRYREAWERVEAEQPAADGWHFLPCADCGGTGRRVN